MSPKDRSSHSSRGDLRWSCPGKVFLLGEYAVLSGAPAVVASVGPRFELSGVSTASALPLAAFPPDSPAGKLFAKLRSEGNEICATPLFFHDPLGGTGGFGASTAQFALLAAASRPNGPDGISDWTAIWKTYRSLTAGEALPPSGADLACQLQGRVGLFHRDGPSWRDLSAPLDWSSVLVFSATSQLGRKVPTHTHLGELASRGFFSASSASLEKLKMIVAQGVSAIDQGSLPGLGKALVEYGDALAEEGLEAEATRADRQALQRLPGVIAVKGAGALQSDAIVVLIDGESPAAQSFGDRVIELASERRLQLIARGLPWQGGLQCS